MARPRKVTGVLNAGKYNKRIRIVINERTTDADGFQIEELVTVLETKASVKTTYGYTLITNDSDFERAFVNFTIRCPKRVEITKDMLIQFNNKLYSIEYVNNITELNAELELQAKVVQH